MTVIVREARAGDGPDLHRIIVALAEHQGEAHLVTASADELEAILCTPGEHRGCLVAVRAGTPVGLAYWYEVFTTYAARRKLYLEDLCVLPEARGTGAGFALMQALAQECVRRGYPRFEWLAMADNEIGKAFYRRCGGRIKEGAETWQMFQAQIAALAEAG